MLEQDKQHRILALDQVLQNQIQMLEFYVDTKDPLAHKHQVTGLCGPLCPRSPLRTPQLPPPPWWSENLACSRGQQVFAERNTLQE